MTFVNYTAQIVVRIMMCWTCRLERTSYTCKQLTAEWKVYIKMDLKETGSLENG
jgi:hypothetical protein